MSFLSDVGNFFGNLFGGGGQEEKKKKQQSQNFQAPTRASSSPSYAAPGQNQQDTSQAPQNQQPDNGLNLVLPGKTQNGPAGFPALLNKAQPQQGADTRSDGQKEIDQLTANNLKKAVDEEKARTSWLDRTLTDRNWQQRAEMTARNRAITQYQDTHGYNNQPEVAQSFQKNEDIGNKLVDNSRINTDNLNGIQDTATKAAHIAQWVPVAGSVLNLGLAGASKLAKASGNEAYANDINQQRNLNEFGMTPEQYAALDEGTRRKLSTIRKVGYGLAPLDFLGLTGLAKSEGVNTAKDAAVQLVKKGAVDEATQQSLKTLGVDTAKNLAKTTAIGTGVSAAGQQYLTGNIDPLEALKTGAMIAGTNELFNPTQLRKAAPEAAGNIHPGLGSTNPNQVEDAVAAHSAATAAEDAQAAAQDINIPVPQQTLAGQATSTAGPDTTLVEQSAPQVSPPQPVGATVAQLAGNQRPEAALQTAIEQAHNAGDSQKVAELITQLPPDMQDPMRSALGIEAPPIPAPTPTPVAPLPTVPTGGAQGGPQVPAAPRTREAAMKQLGDLARQIPGDGNMRDVTNLEQLANDAQGVIANLQPEELVSTFGSRNIEALPNDAKSFAVIRAARDKLSALAQEDPNNGDIKDAIANTIDEMASRASGNGLLQRVVQEEFDAMPLQAKVRYLAKKIDAANKDVEGYEPLSRDPAKAAEVEAALTSRLTDSQALSEQISGLENHLEKAADAAREGQKVDIKDIVKQIKQKRVELQVKNGEVVKYFQNLVPGRTKAQRALVDFPKRMMLASFSGRINDVLTTAANVAHEQSNNLTQGLLAKGYNMLKGRGTVSDTWKGGGKVFGGIKTGLQKFRGESGGNVYVNDIQTNLKGVEDLRSGLRKPSGPVGRTVQAATELATNVTEGVKDQRLYQLADQEAAQLGLSGAYRKQYAEARAAVPSRQMIDAAEKIHLTINNLNDNPISRTLNKVAQSMEGDNKFARTGIGGLIKNQILPFTSWLGGNIWNTVTDKNVAAQFTKFLMDAHRGDPESAIKHLSGTINGAVEGYAIGYQLAAHGMLTDKNAEGYNDGGAYIHIGDRYIPVGAFGFFAPNIVFGKAAYDGVHNDKPAETIAGDLGRYAWNGLALGQALGVENTVQRANDAATRPGGDAQDAAAIGAAGIAGQFIPGITGDVNTFLNNGIPGVAGSDVLNPTHEAADTRVGKEGLTPTGRPSKAKDVPASAAASLKNRIPFLSQTLPRKAGVAAPDFVDRVNRGDRETTAQKETAAKAKTDAEIAADWKKRGVPNFNEPKFDDKVQARFENGNYDQAIEGLQAKYDSESKNKDIPKSKLKAIEDKITLYKVHKDGNFSPDFVDKYKSTSVSEWRNMGDPESDAYDPDTYQKLYEYDTTLAKAGISGSSLAKDKNKYTAKTNKSKSGSKGRADSRITSNALGNAPSLGKVSFGDLAPQKAGSRPIPTIKQIQSSDLIKKRKISVSRA